MISRSFGAFARAAAVLAAAAFCGTGAWAQSASSAIAGAVKTQEGTPVPDAVIHARSEGTGVIRSATTDREGRYRFDLLPPGRWKIWAEIPGGVTSEARIVLLRLQQTTTQDFTIATAATEQVTVTAEPPMLDPVRTGSELRVEGTQAEDLPVDGRTVTDLALLDASILATPPGNFYGERGSVFVVNGQSGRANSFLVDGLDNNDMTSGTTLNASFSQQVIKEFVVLTHQYAAEFGRASGGILNIITERGTNDPSLDFFAQGVAGNLNATGEFVSSLPAQDGLENVSRRFDAGFKLGGPFSKDRAFYLLAYEHQEADQVTPYTGVDRSGIAGGWILAPSRDDNLFLRTDFNLGRSNFLMVRLSADSRSNAGMNVAGTITPEAGFEVGERDAQIAASLTTVISPSLLNEARLLLGSSAFDQAANSDRPGVDRPSGVFGGNNLNHQDRDESKIELVDNLTWKAGHHTPKAGVDVTLSRTRIATRFNPSGNLLYETDLPFEPGDCGDLDLSDPLVLEHLEHEELLYDPIPCPGVVDKDDDNDGETDEPGILGTYPIVFQFIEGHPSATLDDTRIALFAQDSWQITPRFLLDYGLRYDLSTFVLPEDKKVPSIFPNGGAAPDRNNIAPRVGFSFTPELEGTTVIRGGAGIFYDKLVLGFPAVAAITSGTEIGILPVQGFALEITEDVIEQVGIDELKQYLFFPQEFIMRFSTGTRLDTPYTVQYSIGADHAVGVHSVFSGSVTRALGYHQALFKDLNPVDPNVIVEEGEPLPYNCPRTTGPLVADYLPYHCDRTTGSITSIVTEGRSWYTGLDLGWRYRSGTRWYSVSYTWSKAIDMGPDPLKGGAYVPPNSTDLTTERGRSDADRRHRFVLSGASDLPWMGLRLSGVLQVASGAPFNVTSGEDENFDGMTTDRPAGIGRNTGARTDLDAINDLRKDAPISLSPIHSLEEPYFMQVDMRLSRPFSMRGGKGMGEMFVQVFNLFNRFNGGPIDGIANSKTFGEPIGQVGPPRTLEFGLKMGFSPSASRSPEVAPGS